jgi:site-specific recombinase XerD
MEQAEIDKFLFQLSKTKQDWQLEQAKDAIRLFQYFKQSSVQQDVAPKPTMKALWKQSMEAMTTSMRLKHLSYRTEQTYTDWMRKFYAFVEGRKPESLNSQHVTDFLTYLAVERKVAKSTQDQAFNALLYFYRHVLNKDIGDLWRVIRSKRKQRLPVVLSRAEVINLFDALDGSKRLMAQLIYAGGLRLNECLRLRVKDLDFDRGCIIIHAAKGDKDRHTLFPESLYAQVHRHLNDVRKIYETDLKS